MILGGIEGILDKGDAIGTGLEHRFPFLGREINEERHFLKDGLEGDLDGLDVGGREGGVNVLVWSGKLLGIGLCVVRYRENLRQNDQEISRKY